MALRTDNPSAAMLVGKYWPEDEPTPVFLSADNDVRLQQACFTPLNATFKQLRSVALVTIFLGAGRTSGECRDLEIEVLDVENIRPDLYVHKRDPRIARRVPLDSFAIDVLRSYRRARCETSNVGNVLM
jgi:integrase/recombinase XerD